MPAQRFATLKEAVEARVEKTETCWIWQGAVGTHGYGVFTYRYRSYLAHRAAYEAFKCEDAASVLHTCDNPLCCNPDHLFAGTHDDNMADMVMKRRHQFGERRRQAKLTNEQARAVRDAQGTHREIAAEYGIHQSTVSRIKGGVRWRLTCL